jgi:hypothetical protein
MCFFIDVTKLELQKIHVSIIFVIATLAILGTLVFAILPASQRVPNTGKVKAIGVGIYWDSACSQEVSLIPWGSLNPGETKNTNVYVRNEGNVPVVLSMTTDSWNPVSASGYITLSWNRGGYVLNSTASVQAVLTLSVSSSISGVENFSFDIVITGTESS